MKTIISFIFIIFFATSSLGSVQGDVDSNGTFDVDKGGTNITSGVMFPTEVTGSNITPIDSSCTGWSGANWTCSGGVMTHSAGSVAALTYSSGTLTIGKYYNLKFTSTITAGNLYVALGGQGSLQLGTDDSPLTAYNSQWYASATTAISFTPSSDFVGTVTATELFESTNAGRNLVVDSIKVNRSIDILGDGTHKLMRFGSIFDKQAGGRYRAWIGEDSGFYTQSSIFLCGSGVTQGATPDEINICSGIDPASSTHPNEGSGFYYWTDVFGAALFRAAPSGHGSNIAFLDGVTGNFRLSIETDGSLGFGNGLGHTAIDTFIRRVSQGVLDIGGGTTTMDTSGTYPGGVEIAYNSGAGSLLADNYLNRTEYDNGIDCTIDPMNGNKQRVTLSSGCTEISFSQPTVGSSEVTLKVIQGSPAQAPDWGTTVQWPGGVAPTLTTTLGHQDIFSFYLDGSNVFGSVRGADYDPTFNTVVGSVAVNDVKISNSAAFSSYMADISPTYTLGQEVNVGRKLTITSVSNGKKISGYIKSVGSSETLASNAQFTHSSPIYETSESNSLANFSDLGAVGVCVASSTTPQTGTYKILATATGNQLGCASAMTATWGGELTKCRAYINVASGTARMELGNRVTDATASGWSEYPIYYTAGVSSDGIRWWSTGGAATFGVDNIRCNPVTAPAATGVKIKTTAGGSTDGWETVESGFSYNDASGYTFQLQ